MEDRLRYIFSNVNEWLKFAEAKNAILVVANIAAIFGIIQIILGNHKFILLIKIYLLQFILFAALAAILALISFLPNIKSPSLIKKSRNSSLNLLYFGAIAKFNPDEFIKLIHTSCGKNLSAPTMFEKYYAEQIIANSRITLNILQLFNWAMWSTISAFITPVFAFFIYCIYNKKLITSNSI
ncbi:MAG: DUF5706 domain-containing protein [Bacteroidales bacterium]|nr:DUF5706 domain-containing protein [Bacteroidales bacterium]